MGGGHWVNGFILRCIVVFLESLLLSKLINFLVRNRQIYIKFSNAFWGMQGIVAKGVTIDNNAQIVHEGATTIQPNATTMVPLNST
jgi:hypothetical protein